MEFVLVTWPRVGLTARSIRSLTSCGKTCRANRLFILKQLMDDCSMSCGTMTDRRQCHLLPRSKGDKEHHGTVEWVTLDTQQCASCGVSPSIRSVLTVESGVVSRSNGNV